MQNKLGVTNDERHKLEELKLKERSYPYGVTRETDEFKSESDRYVFILLDIIQLD